MAKWSLAKGPRAASGSAGKAAVSRSSGKKVPALLRAAVVRRSAVCLDLALDLLVLPLSYVVLNVIVIITIGAFDPAGTRSLMLTVGDPGFAGSGTLRLQGLDA